MSKMKLSNLKLPTARSPPSNNDLLSSRKHEWSTYQLYTVRRSVDERAKHNNGIREQLKMQRENSQKILSRIQSSMLQTQQNTVDFLSRYEQQKYKNQQLQQLLAFYEKQIKQQKLKQHQNTIDKIENNQFDELTNVLIERQKQLQKLTNKLNSTQCEKNIKYEAVKAQRRQRILISGQFNGFENEIFDLKYKYKQCLIERIFMEKVFEEEQAEFVKTKAGLEKSLKKFLKKKKEFNQQNLIENDSYQRDSQFTSAISESGKTTSRTNRTKNNIINDISNSKKINSNFINGLSFNQELNSSLFKQSFNKSRLRLNQMRLQKNEITSRNYQNQLNEKKIANLQNLKVVKQFLNQLGLGTFFQLKHLLRQDGIADYEPNKQQKIQQNNQSKAVQIGLLQDEIYDWQKRVEDLKIKIQHTKQMKQYETTGRQSQKKSEYAHNSTNYKRKNFQNNILANIDETSSKINILQKQIQQFNESQELQKLISLLEIDKQIFLTENEMGDGDGMMSNGKQKQQQKPKINIDLLAAIQQKFTEIVGIKNQFNHFVTRSKNDKRSIVCWQLPHLQPQEKQSSTAITQKSICPFLEPTKSQNSKRKKTGISHQVGGHNGLKKLSNLLKNQSKIRGPIDIVSKDQMIKQAQQAFNKQGINKMQKFQVKYS